MQNLISWTKANPISLVSIFVALVAIGILAWVHLDGSAFRDDMGKQTAVMRDVEQYMNSRVQVPGLAPADPPRMVGPITINEPALKQIQGVYAKMSGEYGNVYDLASKFNQAGHRPMLPNLFPVPQGSAPFGAKDSYPKILTAMLGPTGSVEGLPTLNAKPPLAPEVIQETLNRIEQQYRIENALGPQGNLEEDQFNELRRRKSVALREQLLDYTRSLSMYAVTEPGTGFPFDIPAWVGEPGTPNEVNLWTGQMMLWIQQDVAAAIALANQVGEPGRDVTDSVVKRLISMQVVRGPVGISNRGGFTVRPGGTSSGSEGTMPMPSGDPNAVPPASADTALPNDFSVAHTGRSSNPIYDVWHVWIEFVADSKSLPRFFNTLNQVNFMTVLSVEMQDVDEYKALEEGYVYGPHDAVEVKMLIETVWLRDWTSRLMPAAVKQMLGIASPDTADTGNL